MAEEILAAHAEAISGLLIVRGASPDETAILMDGVEVHDCFSITEYMAIDHFGITAPGESWKAVEEGTIALHRVEYDFSAAQRKIREAGINASFTRITGYGLAEVVGRRASDLLRGADTDAATAARLDAARNLR